MAEAGYDVAQGDTWALNELTSAVRRGDGNARANIREFLRGLYEATARGRPAAPSLVIGFGQRTSDVSVYQNTLQSWLSDTAFWTDMATYVSDWSQEVYGDLRGHAVPGEPVSVRREYLNDYLQHKLVLAGAGPSEIETARAYLQRGLQPAGERRVAARDAAWGWTMVPVEQMAAYVSAQINAMRNFTASSGQVRDHWGFAWAPRNTTGLLDRATSERRPDRSSTGWPPRSATPANVAEPENPGSGACGLPAGDLLPRRPPRGPGHNESWRSFRAWAQSTLSIGPVSADVRLVAGVASAAARSLSLRPPRVARSTVAVTLRSSVAGRARSPRAQSGRGRARLGRVRLAGARGRRPSTTATRARSVATADRSGGRVRAQASREVTVVSRLSDANLGDSAPRREVSGARGESRGYGDATGRLRKRRHPPTSPGESRRTTLGTFVRGRGRRRSVTFRAGLRGRQGKRHGDGERGTAPSALRPSSCVPATLRIAAVTYREHVRGTQATIAAVDEGVDPSPARRSPSWPSSTTGRVARTGGVTGAAGKARFRARRSGRAATGSSSHAHVAEGFTWNGKHHATGSALPWVSIRRRREGARLLQHLARDHEPLDLVRALVDLGDLRVAHHPLDRVLA